MWTVVGLLGSTTMLRVASLVLTFCLAASSYSATVSSRRCRRGWTDYNGNCYGFGEVQVPWAEAAAICNVYGGKLVEIETSGESNFIKKLARSRGASNIWIGGNDFFQEGVWEWVVNDKVIHPFSDWNHGEPNNDFHGTEDCLTMSSSSGYRWNDAKCNYDLNYICEERL